MTIKPYPKYEEDHYGWLQATIALLKAGNMDDIDKKHLIEDLEDMARSDVRELMNRLKILLAHLLKCQIQPEKQKTSFSWLYTIREQRKQIEIMFKDYPSLKHHQKDVYERAFDLARSVAAADMNCDIKYIPLTCPYTFEQCMDDTFFPESSDDDHGVTP